MVIRRVGPLSVAKIAATLYAVIGLIVGGIFSLIGMAGAFATRGSEGSPFGPFGAMIGAGSIVFFPIMYACLGFVGSLIMAALYNIVAGMVGGVELEVQ
jgi:hypothetical protein